VNVLHSIEELAVLKGPIVLAAGTFDGVHPGHQALIRKTLNEASSCGGTAVALTFDRHPASVLRPGSVPGILSDSAAKISFLETMGLPALLLLEFTDGVAGVEAGDFIRSIAEASKPLRMICVGSQWSFGKGGKGNISMLRKLGDELGFEVAGIEPVLSGDLPISSTRIRAAIAAGDFSEAEACLGRSFVLSGKVVKGAGLGSKIGFPTANLDVMGMQLPPCGVYAVKVYRSGALSRGVCNIGFRPTVDAPSAYPVVEVHLFDVSADLVGEELGLEFVKFLRPEQKFSSLEELREQITRDCSAAGAAFSA